MSEIYNHDINNSYPAILWDISTVKQYTYLKIISQVQDYLVYRKINRCLWDLKVGHLWTLEEQIQLKDCSKMIWDILEGIKYV